MVNSFYLAWRSKLLCQTAPVKIQCYHPNSYNAPTSSNHPKSDRTRREKRHVSSPDFLSLITCLAWVSICMRAQWPPGKTGPERLELVAQTCYDPRRRLK